MASFIKRNKRWRADVRRGGYTRYKTFATKSAAQEWAKREEARIDELRGGGYVDPKGETLKKLITAYEDRVYPKKKWGRSKQADLDRLKKDVGHMSLKDLSTAHLIAYFDKRSADGAGPVVVSAQMGYLITVLKFARSTLRLNVSVEAAQEARTSLKTDGMIGKGGQRDIRVSDAKLKKLIAYFDKANTSLPMSDIIRFCVASGMRISEVCRLQWSDLNRTDRTILIRDRKHPSEKKGNNQTVPLLDATGYDAYQIAVSQPEADERIFPVSHRTVGTYFSRAVTKLKLGDVHLHDLRHEAISRLFASGYGIPEVALVSGHRDWQQLRRYTQLEAKDLHRTPLEPVDNVIPLRSEAA